MEPSRNQPISQAAPNPDLSTGCNARYVISIPRSNGRQRVFAVDVWESDSESETSPVVMHAKTPVQPPTNDSTGQAEAQVVEFATFINQGAYIQDVGDKRKRSGLDMAEQDSSPHDAGANIIEEPSLDHSRPVKRMKRSARAPKTISSKTTSTNSSITSSASAQQPIQAQPFIDSNAIMSSPLPHPDSSPIPPPQPPSTGPPRVARLENGKVSYFHGWFPIPPQFLFDSSMITSNSSRQNPTAAMDTAEQPTSASSSSAPTAAQMTTRMVSLERDMTPYEGTRTMPRWASDLADEIKADLDNQGLPRRAALKKIRTTWSDTADQRITHFSPASGVLRIGERASPLWGWWMDVRLLSKEQWLAMNEVASKAAKEGHKQLPMRYRGTLVEART